MDLSLYLRVLWRFKYVVGVGFILAVFVAFSAYAKISFRHGFESPSISYRRQETWGATSRILVTQQGFPWGRTILPSAVFPTSSSAPTPAQQAPGASTPEYGDPNRFAALAVIYAVLLKSDTIQKAIQERFPGKDVALTGSVVVNPTANSTPLPLVDVLGIAPTRSEAAHISAVGADLFESYIAKQQAAAGIPKQQRILLPVVSTSIHLLAGRKKTLTIVAFLGVMIAAIGLAFILENLRPRVRTVYQTLQRPGEPDLAERQGA